MKKIELSQGKHALVDDSDYDWLNQWKWYYSKGYAVRKRSGDGKTIYMHRELLGLGDWTKSDPRICDHKNRERYDNRRENIRITDQSGNMVNRATNFAQKTGKKPSKYRGVAYHHRDKLWRATVYSHNKAKLAGYFKNEKDAARAYDELAKELHGEYAILNF